MENPQIELARKIIETTDTSLFLTGKAGTGKTTFLRRLRSESPKRMMVLAPTGIAAINAGGTTIHSFFQLSFAPFVPGATYTEKQRTYGMNKQKIKLLRTLDLLVIDEISMVRADLLDAVDDTLKRYRHCTPTGRTGRCHNRLCRCHNGPLRLSPRRGEGRRGQVAAYRHVSKLVS